ncbi:MAG TPA: hypothetical protein VKB51_01410 [bacterium]|nr:hypothetical protein [bacterium]
MTSLRENAAQGLAAPRPRAAVLMMGIALLLLALALGGCLAEEGVPAGSGPVTWTQAAQTFTNEGCTGCHDGVSIMPGLKSTNCADLVNVAAPLGGILVVPGDTSTSVLFAVATGADPSPAPPTNMTFGLQSDIDTLGNWIAGGASCS